MLKLGENKMYSGPAKQLAEACENYLLLQNYIPNAFVIECRQDKKTLTQQRQLKIKQPTPFFVITQKHMDVPGYLLIIRTKINNTFLDAEIRYIEKLKDYPVIVIYNYDAFIDTINHIKTKNNALLP